MWVSWSLAFLKCRVIHSAHSNYYSMTKQSSDSLAENFLVTFQCLDDSNKKILFKYNMTSSYLSIYISFPINSKSFINIQSKHYILCETFPNFSKKAGGLFCVRKSYGIVLKFLVYPGQHTKGWKYTLFNIVFPRQVLPTDIFFLCLIS